MANMADIFKKFKDILFDTVWLNLTEIPLRIFGKVQSVFLAYHPVYRFHVSGKLSSACRWSCVLP